MTAGPSILRGLVWIQRSCIDFAAISPSWSDRTPTSRSRVGRPRPAINPPTISAAASPGRPSASLARACLLWFTPKSRTPRSITRSARANLNKANLKRGSLTGADLTGRDKFTLKRFRPWSAEPFATVELFK
jgi:hypothetical protein